MMKATRSSARIKSTNSISNVNCNEKNYTKETELQNNNRKKNKSRAVNFVSNVENNQSLMNCQEIDQVSDVPVEKKLNFKDLRQELLVANANPTQKQNEDKPKEIFRNLNIMRTELRQLEDPPVSKSEKDLMSARLDFSFFNKPCEELALSLLGKIFVRQLEDGTVLKGRIVETESYIGTVDKASQTYDYRISATNLPLYMPPGTIYIYSTYGMYHCINISSQGDGCAVLIRAIEPIEGIQQMSDNRNSGTKSASKKAKKQFKTHELCNGPAKLCMAYALTKAYSKYSICSWRGLWIEDDSLNQEELNVIHCKRIGIDKCDPTWVKKPLRYYIYNNTSVSKQDKGAEYIFLNK